MAKRPIKLQFPLAGVNRRVGFQSQPPFTTFDANNVRPDSTIEGRARGGSRPGLSRTHDRYEVTTITTPTMNGAPTNTNLGPYSKVFASTGDFSAVGPWTFGGEIATWGSSPSYNSSSGTSAVIRNSGEILVSAMIGGIVVFSDSDTSYVISGVSSPTITVTGDASGESASVGCIIAWNPNLLWATLKFDTSGNVYDVLCSDNNFATTAYIYGDATNETSGDTMVLTTGTESPVRLLGSVRESQDAKVLNASDGFGYSSVTEDTDLSDEATSWDEIIDTVDQVLPQGSAGTIGSSLVINPNYPPGFVGVGENAAEDNLSAAANAFENVSHDLSLNSTVRLSCNPIAQTDSPILDVQYIYAWMNNTLPDPWNHGLSIWTYTVGAASSSQVLRKIGVTERFGDATISSFEQQVFSGGSVRDSGTLSATIIGKNVTVTWSSGIADSTFTHVATNAVNTSYNRVGIGIYGAVGITGSVFGTTPTISNFDFSYRGTTGASYRQRLLSSVSQKLYATGGDTVFAEIANYDGSGTAVNLANNRMCGVEFGGKFYIADDEGVIKEGNDGDITTTDTLDEAGVVWSDHIALDNNAIELFNHTEDSASDGVYQITAVAAGDVTLAGTPANTSAGSVGWRIYRSPKYYDPVEDKLYSWFEAQKDGALGSLPLGCPLIARYNGRIVLAGAPTARHIWYMCKQNNALDWDYSDTTVQGAVAGTSTEVNVVADPITALIPYLDDYLIFSCADSMWVLRGDPKLGGRILNQNQAVGCINPQSWCFMSNGTLVFMGRNGLYSISPGATTEPQELSDLSIPNEFKNITENDDVQLAYDEEGRGIHIFVKRAAGGKSIWWWDEDTKGFWPVSVSSTFFPSAIYSGGLDELGRNLVILGGEDGYLRAFNRNSFDDDGLALNAYVFIGPFRGGGPEDIDGLVNKLVAIIGETSDSVSWAIYTADTAEGVTRLSATASFDSGTWVPGRNYDVNPRCRGGAFALKISSTSSPSGAWAIESIVARVESLGMLRLL